VPIIVIGAPELPEDSADSCCWLDVSTGGRIGLAGSATAGSGLGGESFGFLETELLVGEIRLVVAWSGSSFGLVDSTVAAVAAVSLKLVLGLSLEALLRLLLFRVEMILSMEGREESFEVDFLSEGLVVVVDGEERGLKVPLLGLVVWKAGNVAAEGEGKGAVEGCAGTDVAGWACGVEGGKCGGGGRGKRRG